MAGLLFDEEIQRLYPDVQLDLPAGEDVDCTDDDNPHGIVLAVSRDALPEDEFDIWVEERDPPGCCTENLLRIEAGELAAPSTTTTTPIPPTSDSEFAPMPGAAFSGRWSVASIVVDDAEIDLAPGRPSVRFQGRSLRGNDGCNSFGGHRHRMDRRWLD